MAFLTRYTDDPSTPRVGSAVRDLFVRAVAPAVVLWAAIVGIGLFIRGPLNGIPSEDDLSKDVQKTRTPTWGVDGSSLYRVRKAIGPSSTTEATGASP